MVTSSAFDGTVGPIRPAPSGVVGRLLQRTAFRFVVVGATNTGIDFGLFVLLSAVGVPVVVANTASTSAGLLFSYFANRRFTFGVGGRHDLRGVLLFLGVTGVGLWVLQPLVILAVTALLPAGLPVVVAACIGKAAGIGVGLVWNFTLYRAVVFRIRTPR